MRFDFRIDNFLLYTLPTGTTLRREGKHSACDLADGAIFAALQT
jgi:hypothetical protein